MVKGGREDKRLVQPTQTVAKASSLGSKVEFSEELVKKLERDLKRNAFTVLTPYTLAQAYGIRISAAKKVLREAASRGLLKLYSGGRTPIYVKPDLLEKLGHT